MKSNYCIKTTPSRITGLHLLGKFSWKDRGVGKFSVGKSAIVKILLKLEIMSEVGKSLSEVGKLK